MKITISSTGDFRNISEILAKAVNKSPVDMLKIVGEQGKRSLADNTPKDTGRTAAGWNYDIITTRESSEVSWYNTGHPGLKVNVARIIETGHGTGNGGYVPPRPYIKQAMNPVWDEAGDVLKELME